MWKKLDRCDIPTPCSVGWDSLTGTAQVRYCGQCQKEVHNLSALTRKEAETLIVKYGGNLCAAFERDAHGRIKTLDLPSLAWFGGRFAKVVGAALATLIGVSPTFAASTARADASAPSYLAKPLTPSLVQIAPRPKAGKTMLTGKVVGPDNQPLKGAKVILFHKNGWDIYNTKTNKEGDFRLTGLLPGAYTLEVRAKEFPGFSLDITFEKGQSLTTDVTLSKPSMIVAGGLCVATSPADVLLRVVKAPFKVLKKLFR